MGPVALSLDFRVFALLVLIAVLATGCDQRQSLATTTEQVCSRRFLRASDEYTLLGFSAPSSRNILVSVIRVRRGQEEIAFQATPKTIGEPARARLPADAELEKAEVELATAKAEAEAVNRELDGIEARVEAGRVEMGNCFGVGFYGNQAAENYARAKKAIAEHRESEMRTLNRVLDWKKLVAERAAIIERWRADNASHLKKGAGNAALEIVEIARLEFSGIVRPRVTVAVTNTTSSTILRPRNRRVWGYDVHPELGGSTPIGTSLWDSFGNSYKLERVSPRFYGNEGRGIRPGETRIFEAEFADMPLENTKSVLVVMESGAYGQNQRIDFVVPADVFFGGMAGRSQDRR